MYNEELTLTYEKSQIRLREEVERMRLQDQSRMNRSLEREAERELAKAQCEVIYVDDDGIVHSDTQNLRVSPIDRKITNFTHPEITLYVRNENRDEVLYLMTFDLDGDIQFVFLLPQKCQSPTYIIGKIAEKGGTFFAGKQADCKKYARQLVTLLIRNNEARLIIPDRRGWFVDENDKMEFFNGKWTWKEALVCAK